MKELLEAWQQALTEWRTAYLEWKGAQDQSAVLQRSVDEKKEAARKAEEAFAQEVTRAAGWTKEEWRGG